MFYINKKIFIGICAVCLALGLAVGIMIMMPKIAVKDNTAPAPVEAEHVNELTTDTIKEELVSIGELATTKYNITAIESYSDSVDSIKIAGFTILEDTPIPLTEKSFVYSYDGTVKAGIDMTEVKIVRNRANKTLKVTVPDAKILSTEIDYDSFNQILETNNILNPISISDKNASDAELVAKMNEQAIEKNILPEAKEYAVRMIKAFLRNTSGLEDYQITVE